MVKVLCHHRETKTTRQEVMSIASDSNSSVFNIHSRRFIRNIFIFCLLIELTFFLLDAFVNYGKLTEIGAIRRLCNLAREDSLSSWFGSMQTLMVGFTLMLIFLRVRKEESLEKWRSFSWCALAIFFIYMAVDDGAEVHERLGTLFKEISTRATAYSSERTLGGKLLDFFPSYPWQILLLPIFGGMGLYMLIFLWRELSGRLAFILVIAGITCFMVAVAMDFVEGLDEEHVWNFHIIINEKYQLDHDAVRHFSKSIEETIEMLGTTFFWIAFMSHFSKVAGKIQLQFIHKD